MELGAAKDFETKDALDLATWLKKNGIPSETYDKFEGIGLAKLLLCLCTCFTGMYYCTRAESRPTRRCSVIVRPR